MKLRLLLLLFCCTTLLGKGYATAAQTLSLSVDYFSEQIDLQYHSSMLIPQQVSISEKSMVSFYKSLEKTNYQVFLESVQQKKEQFNLNDWLTYTLLNEALSSIFDQRQLTRKKLTTWFLLSKMGFDTRLTYLDREVNIYAYSRDEVFEVPMIEDKGRKFVNLTGIREKAKMNKPLYLLNFSPNPKGSSFSFYLNELPELTPELVEQKYLFPYRDSVYQLTIKADKTIRDIMLAYPIFAEDKYLEVPFSKALANSLLPQLEQLLVDRSEKEKLELLAAFTRSSFDYREDKKVFGKSKPMIADELFHYPYSDCEDRSALYYSLVKQLVDLPMVIVAFSDHLTVGVATQELKGTAISYRGKKYYICDPTGPANSSVVGEFPQGYERKSFHIIGSYK